MMNTVRKSENLLPFPVISAAANGDTTAMCAILKHYEGYIWHPIEMFTSIRTNISTDRLILLLFRRIILIEK